MDNENKLKNLKDSITSLKYQNENHKNEQKRDNENLKHLQKNLDILKERRNNHINKIRNLSDVNEYYDSIIKESESTYVNIVNISSKLATCLENEIEEITNKYLN